MIRIVPRVEREEFLNTGVVLYCASKKFLQVQFTLDAERVKAFAGNVDIEEIRQYLCAFERICAGAEGSGPIGRLTVAERFRWLTATRSTIVQASKVHPGLCDDPKEALGRLYDELVA